MSRANTTVGDQSAGGSAALFDDRSGIGRPTKADFPRYEKKPNIIPVSLPSPLPTPHPPLDLCHKQNLNQHQVGQIVLAPHVYVESPRDAKIYSGDVHGMAHYWPAIIVKTFARHYLCVPIHTFNGRGPDMTDTERRKEYMYITTDGTLTPTLEQARVDATRVLEVKHLDTDYSQLSFDPKDGSTVTVSCHFDLPLHSTYQLLGSITTDSLEKLLQFFSELHGLDQRHRYRELEITQKLLDTQRQSASRIEELSTKVKNITFEKEKLQAEMTEKNEEIQKARDLIISNSALTESNVDLSKKNKDLNYRIKSIRDHNRAESLSWQTKNSNLTRTIESQKLTIASKDKMIAEEKAAHEKLTTTIKGQEATIVTQAATVADMERKRHRSETMIENQQAQISNFEKLKTMYEEQIDTLKEAMGEYRAQSREFSEATRAAQDMIGSLQKDYNELGKIAHDLQKKLTLKDQRIESLNADLEQLKIVVQGKTDALDEPIVEDEPVVSAMEQDPKEHKSHGKLFNFSRFLGSQ